jgi:hypothetical protein
MSGDKLALGAVAALAALSTLKRRGSRSVPPEWNEEIRELVESGDPDNIQQAIELNKMFAEGDDEVEGLAGIDLSGADLSGFDFTNMDLRGTNLRDTKLVGTNFMNADLRNADLSYANLTYAYLGGANLLGANIESIDTYATNYDVNTQWPANTTLAQQVKGMRVRAERREQKRAKIIARDSTPLTTEDYSETVRGMTNSVTFSPDGIGSIPIVRNIEYMGFMVWMRPSDFQALNPLRGNDASWMEQQIRDGRALGIPYLRVKPPEKWWKKRDRTEKPTLDKLTFTVMSHEGRTRMRAIKAVVGDVLVPVGVQAGYTRAHDWTPANLAGAAIKPDPAVDRLSSIGKPNQDAYPFTIRKFALAGRLYTPYSGYWP